MRRTALAVLLFAAGAATHAAQGDERVTAPAMLFTPPAAGTYSLPPIFTAPGGRVLDDHGRGHSLGEYTTGRVTLFSFIYTTCGDPAGCPLALSTLAAVREKLARGSTAERATRFVSISFDPEHDTPPVMQLLARHFAEERRDPAWHFLTSASYAHLAPMLEGFGQDAALSLAGWLTGSLGGRILFGSVFGNPADLIRVVALSVAGTPNVLGAAGDAWVRFLGGATSAGVAAVVALTVWMIAPLLAGVRLIGTRDL